MPLRAQRIKTLVVDDAAFMRKALVDILSSDDDIEVVGVARHGREAIEAVQQLDPHVITLDVDMPVMDGLTTIKYIMVRYQKPVVMVSALAEHGRITLEALRLGAVDFFPKPSGTVSYNMHTQARELHQLIKKAFKVDPTVIKRARRPKEMGKAAFSNEPPGTVVALIADIGSSSALIRMLANLSPRIPVAFLVCQGISGHALRSYVKEMDYVMPWKVICKSPVLFQRGLCLISHMNSPWGIRKRGNARFFEAYIDEKMSVDQMLQQLAQRYGPRACAVILGGINKDGVRGLKAIQERGGLSLVLEPRYSTCDVAAKAALSERAAEAAPESILWAKIEAFGRRWILEKAGEQKERSRDGQGS